MPVPRRGGKVSDIDACGLTYTELMELWLGPNPTGSCFCSREELVAAWAAGRAVVMRLWGSDGRRPMAWWQFDTELRYPGHCREKSFLWQHGILGPEERLEVEAGWRQAFDEARRMGARERREHYEHHDIPDELIQAWTAARRRRGASSGASPAKVQENALNDS